MPILKRRCVRVGCRQTITSGSYCAEHDYSMRREAQKAADARRGSQRERGYTRRWERARLVFLAAHPICKECDRQGRVEPANVVDHIIPHRGDDNLFWDSENWQALCASCHSRKTARGE